MREEFQRALLLQQALRERCKPWLLLAQFLRVLPRQCALAAWGRRGRAEVAASPARVCVLVLVRPPG